MQVENVDLEDANPDAGSDCGGAPCDFGEFTVMGGLRIADDIYAAAELAGRGMTTFAFVRGVLTYANGNSKVLPRDAADIQ